MLRKEINFQGKDVNLSELIDKDSASEIINQDVLSRLVEKEKISIGNQNAFSSIGYVKDYYIERTLHRQRIKAEVLNSSDEGLRLLFITGASREALTMLGAKNEDIDTWEENT